MRWSGPARFLVAMALALSACAEAPASPSQSGDLPRLVSLNPSITNIVLALGARDALVGVDDWSAKAQPAISALPHVGGLFNPSLESILALAPDVVALVPSAQQRDIRARLTDLGIEVLVLENLTLAQVLKSIATLGDRLGRAEAANARLDAIRSAFAETKAHNAERSHPRTVLVLQRDPLYVVGKGSFLDEMLSAAGAENLGAEFEEEYPRAGVEWLIAAAPELLLDAGGDAESARAHWSRWPSMPAVAAGRIVSVPAENLTMPGPDLDRSLGLLATLVDRARTDVAAKAGSPARADQPPPREAHP